jgi:hypothetical protein
MHQLTLNKHFAISLSLSTAKIPRQQKVNDLFHNPMGFKALSDQKATNPTSI